MALARLGSTLRWGPPRISLSQCHAVFPLWRVMDGLTRSQYHRDAAGREKAASSEDTIFALSTGGGRAAVAVVRLSGPQSDAALAALLSAGAALPVPRTASLASLRHPSTRELLDRALVLRFPGPRSFTGEDCAELHLHGGPAVVAGVLDALEALPALRPAAPGEFARRAFAHGKLDLTQVEGLADLLAAETRAQARQALRSSGGTARAAYEGWRSALLACLARVEAVIDFGEDEGIADDVALSVVEPARQLRQDLERHLGSSRAGELVRSGVRVAIVGPPNAGKSSLLNALAGRPAAIVSPLAGTTRDVVEVSLDLGGFKVVVSDSAGIRETADPIEAEGVRRAQEAAEQADIVVLVEDALAGMDESAEAWLQGLQNSGQGRQQQQQRRAGESQQQHGEGQQQRPSQHSTSAHASVASTEHTDGAQGRISRSSSSDGGGSSSSDGGGSSSSCRISCSSTSSSSSSNSNSSKQPAAVLWLRNKADLVPHHQWGQEEGRQQQPSGRQLQLQQQQTHNADAIAMPSSSADAMSMPSSNNGGSVGTALARPAALPSAPLHVSCLKGEGLDAFVSQLQQAVQGVVEGGRDPAATALVTRARHRHHIQECVAALARYEIAPLQLELAAEELRAAAHALGKVTGAIDTEAVLDNLFSEFCIGK